MWGCIFILKGNTFVKGNLFGVLRKDSPSCWLHSNGEVEMAVYEWLEKQESDI